MKKNDMSEEQGHTDGGRNPHYEGLFDGETEEARERRIQWAMNRRPSRETAEKVIAEFLESMGWPGCPFKIIEDGDSESAENKCGWAFWTHEDDDTSYLHEDLTIEWYGCPLEEEDDA